VFGKQDNTNAINLSDIAHNIGGFVIIGESADDQSGWSVSSAGDCRTQHTIYLGVIYRLDRRHHKHPQLNHLSHHH
jgi:hypothetical protein